MCLVSKLCSFVKELRLAFFVSQIGKVENRKMAADGNSLGLKSTLYPPLQIRTIDRGVEIPHEGAFCGMSRPSNIAT